jgi:hypothetical protein
MVDRNIKMEKELMLAYRHAMKSGATSFSVAFKDKTQFEINCEDDVTEWIRLYYVKEKEKELEVVEDEFKECKECQC